MVKEEEIEKYLSICKECEHVTCGLIKKKDPVPLHIRMTGNIFRRILNKMNIRMISCKQCGCCMSVKARIMGYKGCPENKW